LVHWSEERGGKTERKTELIKEMKPKEPIEEDLCKGKRLGTGRNDEKQNQRGRGGGKKGQAVRCTGVDAKRTWGSHDRILL